MGEFLDFLLAFMDFMSYFGTATTGWADFTGDGWCGSADLIEFLSNFQPLNLESGGSVRIFTV